MQGHPEGFQRLAPRIDENACRESIIGIRKGCEENGLNKNTSVFMMNGENKIVNSNTENDHRDYEVIVACKSLKGGIGNVLTDMGHKFRLRIKGL